MRTLVCVWLAAAVVTAATHDEDAYPADITPPAGTQYPCALTALPHTLGGVPESERTYVDHVYAQVLRGIHAKLRVLKAVEGSDARVQEQAWSAYQIDTERVTDRIAALATPAGLEPFRDDVLAALRLQRAFFAQAVELRRSGGSMDAVWRIAEGRQASQHLISAWSKMQARYPRWSAETGNSVYHHLCALDLF